MGEPIGMQWSTTIAVETQDKCKQKVSIIPVMLFKKESLYNKVRAYIVYTEGLMQKRVKWRSKSLF